MTEQECVSNVHFLDSCILVWAWEAARSSVEPAGLGNRCGLQDKHEMGVA